MESAGGLIVNRSDFVLFIKKKGKLDLPKGRVEPGGSYQETALREVVEETSIVEGLIEIASPLCHTWHVTSYGAKKYVKKTTWFVIEYSGEGESLRPQLEEGITECRWIHPGSFRFCRSEMRPRIAYLTNLWKKAFFEMKMPARNSKK